MNYPKKTVLLFITLAVLVFSSSVFADDFLYKTQIGEELRNMGFIRGDSEGNLNLDGKLTREQAVVIFCRLMGREAEAELFQGLVTFKDIKNSYYKPFIGYAVSKGWITGRDKKGEVFGFGDDITLNEFLALSLRALGYTEYKGQRFLEVGDKATELGLTEDVRPENVGALTRGDSFIIIKNTLFTDVKNSKISESLYETLLYKKYDYLKDKIVIIHTNDMQGFFLEGRYDGMGASKLKRLIEVIKDKASDAVYVDAGDALYGSSFSSLTKGEGSIDIMNGLGLEATVVGAHDTDYGFGMIDNLLKKAKFPILAANIVDESGQPIYTSYMIREIKGKKIAFIGLTTPDKLCRQNVELPKGIYFEDPVISAKETITALSGKADLFVALTHLGDGKESDYTSKKLAEEVPELSLIIDGNNRLLYNGGVDVNGVKIVSAAPKIRNVGLVIIDPEDLGVIDSWFFTQEESANINAGRGIEDIIDRVLLRNDSIGKIGIGKAEEKLEGSRKVVRKGASNLGNLLTAALIDETGADFAFVNGGGIRSSIYEGLVTKDAVLKVLPFGYRVVVLEIKGKDIKKALEHGFSKYPELSGAFPHIGGMTVKFDSSRVAGSRLVKVLVNGIIPIEDDKVYTLATDDFLLEGGDGYSVFKDKKIVGEFRTMADILMSYIEREGVVKVKDWLSIIEN